MGTAGIRGLEALALPEAFSINRKLLKFSHESVEFRLRGYDNGSGVPYVQAQWNRGDGCPGSISLML